MSGRRTSIGAWIVLGLGFLYFVVPLIATGQFSLETGKGQSLFAAYLSVLNDPNFWQSFRLSVLIALATVVLGLLLVVPAAFWAHLRVPRLRPLVELFSIMSFVVPPIVLVFGIARLYSSGFGPLSIPTVMLLAAYGILALPYLFRAVDNGLRSIDVKSMTEAALNLGAGWGRILFAVILPNLRGALLGGSFLVFALIMGEYAVSSMLGFNTFGVYMLLTGENKAQAAAALALISFAMVWILISLMQVFNRGNFTLGSGAH